MSTQYKLVRCNINGKDVEQMVDVRASLRHLCVWVYSNL